MLTKDEFEKALKQAFLLGQTYWRQADSQSYAENKRSDATLAKFNALLAEALSAIEQQGAEPVGCQLRKWVDNGMPEGTLSNWIDATLAPGQTVKQRYDELKAAGLEDTELRLLYATPPAQVEKPIAWGFMFEDGRLSDGDLFLSQQDAEQWFASDLCQWEGKIVPLYAGPNHSYPPPSHKE